MKYTCNLFGMISIDIIGCQSLIWINMHSFRIQVHIRGIFKVIKERLKLKLAEKSFYFYFIAKLLHLLWAMCHLDRKTASFSLFLSH